MIATVAIRQWMRFGRSSKPGTNAWLLDKCIAYAKAHRHPELTEQTVWEVFEAERPKLVLGALRADALQVGLRQRHLGCRHPLLVAGLLAGQEVRDGIGFCRRLRRCGSPSTCPPRSWDRLCVPKT
jgi:hypothetical protein